MEDQAGGSERAQCEYSGYSGILGDSEDSDEELIAEPLLAPCEEPSVLGRLGLSSCEEMTEEEVECAFGQFAMAFHCDQYTLTQRLRAEEHDRTVALENLQLELQHTRDALQVLCVRMVNGEVREKVKQLEESLQTLENSMENIITAAETLGATHQEARMSRAVELMSLHVDHLKRRQSVENAELLQTRKLLQRARGRLLSDSADDGELKQLVGDPRQVTRRRVSVTLIPTQAQLTDLEVKFLESCRSAEEPDSQNQDGSVLKSARRCAVLPVDGSVERSPSHRRTDPSIQPANEESTDGQEEHTASDGFPSPLQVSLRCRRRTALKSDQSSEEREESVSESSTAESHDPADIIQSEPIGHAVQRPLLYWLSRSRRTLMVLLVLCGTAIILLILLFYLRAPLHRT
ncbi:inositol 1,4,5-triphosphate receptor associated 2 isoform X2 [Colossoma macropomum]|uniref:inositol 1,4,5-triphosphate receptor associated 2 isoform X2 n=1 Tax=Colossoma macropomum TaxID=42526 RepID=UPI0018647447|nr:inositol 1,4,5-triphosphate receptor associated 2 isoform X2 [Colossoma macropomum]